MLNTTLLYSYIDPVSGVILLQLVIGGCIGGCAFFWGKMKSVIPFAKERSTSSEQLESNVSSSGEIEVVNR